MAPENEAPRRDEARGNRIRVRREQLGLSLERLLERQNTRRHRLLASVSVETLESWEQGEDPGEKLPRLAEALKVNWRFLDTGVEDVGTRIAQLRLERGMSQKDLATKAGLKTDRTVQAWEGGRAGGIEQATLVQVARVLGASPQFLLTGEHEERDEVEPGDDTESRLRYLEGAVARLGETERRGGMRGFPEVAQRIAELRGSDPGATVSALREDVQRLEGQVEAMVLAWSQLRRRLEGPAQSGMAAPPGETPAAKRSPKAGA